MNQRKLIALAVMAHASAAVAVAQEDQPGTAGIKKTLKPQGEMFGTDGSSQALAAAMIAKAKGGALDINVVDDPDGSGISAKIGGGSSDLQLGIPTLWRPAASAGAKQPVSGRQYAHA